MSQISAQTARLVGQRASGAEVRLGVALQAALLLLIVGNLVRIPVFTTGGGERAVPLLFNDIVVGVFITLAAVAAIVHQRLRLDAVALFGLGFAAVGGLSAVAGVSRFGLTITELVVALAFLARWLMYYALYIAAINTLRRRDVMPVWRALETCVLLFAGFGIVQAAFLPDFALIIYPESRPTLDWDAQQHRLVSTILDPNYAGALIMMVLLTQIAMVACGRKVSSWKLLVLVAALLLTLSRSSLLGFALGIAVIVLARGLSRRLLAMLAGAGVVVLAALPQLIRFADQYHKLDVDASALGRLVSWAHEWTVFTEHPIFGIGFNSWGAIQRRHGWEAVAAASFGVEGGLLFIAVLTGAVGLLLYLGMLVVVFRRSRAVWRNLARAPEERGLSMALPAITLAMVVHSLFSNSLLHPLLMEPFWILCALGFVVAREPITAMERAT